MTLTAEQQVFMLFFAIFWGMVANVQPRWKAFHWTLVGRHGPACKRVALSVIVLNFIPLLIFGYVMSALKGCDHSLEPLGLHLVIHGVIPAFTLFGCYRLWLTIVELYPNHFYSAEGGVPKEYQHIEPTYRHEAILLKDKEYDIPVVYLGEDTFFPNFVGALVYLIPGLLAPSVNW